jgi:multiple sugar transport system substrate-binding protein
VFERLNVPMPDYNWTYEEMLDLIRYMTRPDQGIFGYNYFIGPITYAPIVLNDALSEFGWDGQNYNLGGAWADALNLVAEFRRLGNQAIIWTEEWMAVSGDASQWPGNSGRVAMQLDAWWTLNNIYAKSEAIELGIDMVPYVVPRGANSVTNRKPSFLDFGAISAGTRNPREAYEALKWMSWSEEAWYHRLDGFWNLTDEAGNRLYDLPNCLPTVDSPALWAEYRKLYPPDPAYDAFFELCREPVPLGGQGILGFDEWLGTVYFGGDYNGVVGVEAAVFQGAINAHDAVADLNAKGRAYFEEMMDAFRWVYGN